jgi:hypothetical protein
MAHREVAITAILGVKAVDFLGCEAHIEEAEGAVGAFQQLAQEGWLADGKLRQERGDNRPPLSRSPG